jgi:hypothetical protein
MDDLNPYEKFIADSVREIAAEVSTADQTVERVTVMLVHRMFPEIITKGEIPDWVVTFFPGQEYHGPRTEFYDRYHELLPLVTRFLSPRIES